MKPSTLEEVARSAGVSKMTVSHAVRGGAHLRRMSAETRERVLNAAKELNYVPNSRARALRLGQSDVIALYAGHGIVNVRNPYFTEIVSGLQEGCEEVHKDLLLHGIFHKSSQSLAVPLAQGKFDGLVVSMPSDDPLQKIIVKDRIPAVAVADPVPGIPAVVVDDERGGKLIAEHLHEKGHTRLIYACSPYLPISAIRRRDSFLAEAQRLGMNVRTDQVDWDTNEVFVERALAHGATAIACWNDVLAQQLYSVCIRLGIAVPSQIAITGFDGFSSPFDTHGTITTVAAPWAEVARLAVCTLDSILRSRSVPGEVVLPVSFRKGVTT